MLPLMFGDIVRGSTQHSTAHGASQRRPIHLVRDHLLWVMNATVVASLQGGVATVPAASKKRPLSSLWRPE